MRKTQEEDITWVYASVSVARSVGWMRVKSDWCVERAKSRVSPGGSVSGSDESSCEWGLGFEFVRDWEIREWERRIRDWKIRKEIGNLRVRVWQMWEVRFKRRQAWMKVRVRDWASWKRTQLKSPADLAQRYRLAARDLPPGGIPVNHSGPLFLVWRQAGAREPPGGWVLQCFQGSIFQVAPGGREWTARRLLQSWNFFVFLGYYWVGFNSIVLPPTFHSCTHTFSVFSTSNQAFTLKQNIQFT